MKKEREDLKKEGRELANCYKHLDDKKTMLASIDAQAMTISGFNVPSFKPILEVNGERYASKESMIEVYEKGQNILEAILEYQEVLEKLVDEISEKGEKDREIKMKSKEEKMNKIMDLFESLFEED